MDADGGVFGLDIIHARGVLTDAKVLVHGIDRHHAFAAVGSGKQFVRAWLAKQCCRRAVE